MPFSKSNMNVSNCPLLSNILAQSFITVVNWVSQLCLFLNAFCPSDRSLYPSRWAMNLNILCVRVTCKVHKSRKPGDHCSQVTCHSSWKEGRHLQETIPLGFHQCQLIAEKNKQKPNSIASSFRTLGWSSSGPKALEGFKPLRSLITPSLETTISFMKGADLSRSGTWVCSFLLNTSVNRPLNSSAFSRSDWATAFPFFLFRGGIPWVSFSDYWCINISLWGLP